MKIEVVEWAVRGLRRGMVGRSVEGDGSGQVVVGGGVREIICTTSVCLISPELK